MGIGNIGWTEFLVILAIALIFFGPRRLPGIAQTIGKSLREFQKALNEVKSEIAQAGREADTRAEITRLPARPSEYPPSPTIQPPGGDSDRNAPTEASPAAPHEEEASPSEQASPKEQVEESGATPSNPDAPAASPQSGRGSFAEPGEVEDEEDRGPHLSQK